MTAANVVQSPTSTMRMTSVCSSKESDHQAALYDSTSFLETCGQSRTLKLCFRFFPWPTDRDSNNRGRLRHEKPSGERVGGVLRTRANGVFIRHTAPGDELRVQRARCITPVPMSAEHPSSDDASGSWSVATPDLADLRCTQ